MHSFIIKYMIPKRKKKYTHDSQKEKRKKKEERIGNTPNKVFVLN